MTNEFVKIHDPQFDVKQNKEIIEIIETYAVGSILMGKDVDCTVNYLIENCSTLNYRCHNNGFWTNVQIKFPMNKESYNYKFIISFNDNEFNPSGFKGVFNRERYKYRLQRSGNHFDYEITTNVENHTQQVIRLLKLFRKYL